MTHTPSKLALEKQPKVDKGMGVQHCWVIHKEPVVTETWNTMKGKNNILVENRHNIMQGGGKPLSTLFSECCDVSGSYLYTERLLLSVDGT